MQFNTTQLIELKVPFNLLWKYKRVQAIKKPILCKYELVSDEEYSTLYNKSVSKFLEAYTSEYNVENAEKYRDQADKDNFGVTHF